MPGKQHNKNRTKSKS